MELPEVLSVYFAFCFAFFCCLFIIAVFLQDIIEFGLNPWNMSTEGWEHGNKWRKTQTRYHTNLRPVDRTNQTMKRSTVKQSLDMNEDEETQRRELNKHQENLEKKKQKRQATKQEATAHYHENQDIAPTTLFPTEPPNQISCSTSPSSPLSTNTGDLSCPPPIVPTIESSPTSSSSASPCPLSHNSRCRPRRDGFALRALQQISSSSLNSAPCTPVIVPPNQRAITSGVTPTRRRLADDLSNALSSPPPVVPIHRAMTTPLANVRLRAPVKRISSRKDKELSRNNGQPKKRRRL